MFDMFTGNILVTCQGNQLSIAITPNVVPNRILIVKQAVLGLQNVQDLAGNVVDLLELNFQFANVDFMQSTFQLTGLRLLQFTNSSSTSSIFIAVSQLFNQYPIQIFQTICTPSSCVVSCLINPDGVVLTGQAVDVIFSNLDQYPSLVDVTSAYLDIVPPDTKSCTSDLMNNGVAAIRSDAASIRSDVAALALQLSNVLSILGTLTQTNSPTTGVPTLSIPPSTQPNSALANGQGSVSAETSTSNIPLIAGVSVGGVVLVAGLLVFALIRKRNQKQEHNLDWEIHSSEDGKARFWVNLKTGEFSWNSPEENKLASQI